MNKIQGWIVSAAASIITAAAIYMATQLNKLTDSVTRMEVQLSVVTRVADDHEGRIRYLEKQP